MRSPAPRPRAAAVALLLLAAACGAKKESVVVYVSVDEDQAIPILDAFEAESGVDVKRQGEPESARSLGNVQRLNTGPLDDGAIRRLFERVIDEARRLERVAE